MTALVLYMPVLHAGYLSLLNKYYRQIDALYIIDQDIIDRFPRMQREIRAIPPQSMADLLSHHDLNVTLANDKTLTALAKKKPTLITTNEAISDYLISEYFADLDVKQETVFLRFDEKTVQAARQEIPFTGTISANELDKKILSQLQRHKERSADWFLQVAAALVIDKAVIEETVNQRMPTAHAMWTLGDPRNYVEYGTDTHQRTVLHAEQVVLAHAARDGIKTEGASMYVTAFPCPDCCQIIAESGIKTIYFVDGYSQLSSTETLEHYGIEIIKVVGIDQTTPEPSQKAQLHEHENEKRSPQ